MTIRPAAPADGPEMLRLMESHPAKGNLNILYTRRPDAYKSYLTECADVEITLCTGNDGRLLAQVACLPRRLYVNRESRTVGYVTGLHKAEGAFVNIMKLLEAGRVRSSAKQFFCSILDDNKPVFDLFAKRGLIHTICNYTTYLIHPKAVKPIRHNLLFRPAQAGDGERLLRFYREEGSRYSYFPVFSTMNDFPGLSMTNFFILEDSAGIAAAGALWDQSAFKQYVALGYKGVYKLAALCSPLLSAWGYPPLPAPNTASHFAYISFLLYRKNNPELERVMLGEIAAAGGSFDFLVIGAAADDSLGMYLKNIKSYKFNSKLCILDYDGSGSLAAICETTPRFECGLL